MGIKINSVYQQQIGIISVIDDEKRAPYNYMKPNIKMASKPDPPTRCRHDLRSTVTKHYYFPIKVFSELKSVMCAL